MRARQAARDAPCRSPPQQIRPQLVCRFAALQMRATDPFHAVRCDPLAQRLQAAAGLLRVIRVAAPRWAEAAQPRPRDRVAGEQRPAEQVRCAPGGVPGQQKNTCTLSLPNTSTVSALNARISISPGTGRSLS